MSTQPNSTDERAGLPSGSGAKRWLMCPGSHLAEIGLPNTQTDEASEGEMLHKVMETGESTHRAKLTEEQERCIEFCRETREKLAAELLGDELVTVAELVEQRWWLHDPATLNPVASCRIDWAGINGTRMLILDWKFGRREVTPADTNEQLRFAAALASCEYAPETVYVGIVAPRSDGERVTVARFTAEQCEAARAEMVAGALRAMQPGQLRRPSSGACHYCKARGTSACPESIAETTALATMSSTEIASPERVAELLDKCELAERVIDAIRTGARRMLESGVAVPGWRLKAGAKIKKVSAQAAWAKIGQQIGGSAFAEACTVSVPKLAAGWKCQHTELSEKAARAAVESMLGDEITITENAPSLSREVSA